tara:strand:+ start:9828 stop:13385 length:3558 start_codon:yes stop_codon:yes gene_type:complete
MSSTDRQNRLLLAEDWKKIYQSFRNAEFQSYDFDSLRRAMITYLRNNYPEDFNDYIETSEYLALIDLIAFLGQNIAYRVDLNARENYLELAERRESVLRLARLLSYNPRRNQAANGLLKFDSVKTTESLVDSNGNNLADQTIIWNDPSNTNWAEQFTRVLNSALPTNNTVGKPGKNTVLNSVRTQTYRFNSSNTDVPIFTFTKGVNGISTPFEIVSTDIDLDNSVLEEEPPLPGNQLQFLYREDGRGNGSSNTGYFLHFRQGSMTTGDFTVANPSANQRINIEAENINDSDVWLFKLDNDGIVEKLWTKVPATEGNNAIFNSLSKGVRDYYAVQTRTNDEISLIFADGTFGNVPSGSFRTFYRTSANRSMRIAPSELTDINFSFDYLSKSGRSETMSVTLELKDTITNASTSESSASIRNYAPQTYYTQNRMITGEDYNITPLTTNQEIIKTKATNRISSGISRYFDLKDVTGKYSSTNLYGSDGVLYREEYESKKTFTFSTQTDIEGQIENTILPTIQSRAISNYYFGNYSKIIVSDLNATWTQSTKGTNISTGLLKNTGGVEFQVGSFTGGSLKYVETGALLKFKPPAGFYFIGEGELTSVASEKGASSYKWVKVISVDGSGTTVNATTGAGPIVFNEILPANSILEEVKPKLVKDITADVRSQIIDQVFAYKTFGLRYDQVNRIWRVIINENLNVNDKFSNGKTGDVTNNKLDASWIILFQTNGEKYTVTNRGLRYIFESDKELSFYYDSQNKIYDSSTGQLVKDKIGIMNFNNKPDSLDNFNNDIDWEIVTEYRNTDGYINSKKVEVSFFDLNDDGSVDDPDIFDNVVAPATNSLTKYIFLKKETTDQGFSKYNYLSTGSTIQVKSTETDIGAYSQYATDPTVFYIVDQNNFKILSGGTLSLTSDYQAFVGRDSLKFHYVHSADESNRIDPSVSNIIDIYLLTRSYDIEFRKFLAGTVTTKPLPPSVDNLFQQYGQNINNTKSISDEVIYHPVKYKVLFGKHAEENLQATFKVVKNNENVINDNDIKVRIVQAINRYFALQNWDFGEVFHFTELATFVMNSLAPDLVNFLLVPKQGSLSFGSLYEIKSENDELFVSDATVSDIEVIDSVTASRIQASGTVLTASTSANTGIQSQALTVTSTSATTTSTASTSTSSTSSSSSGSSSGSGGGGSSGGGGGYGY